MFDLDANKEYGEVHPSSMVSCENMVKMSELSEAAILHNLRLRYTDNEIYVRILIDFDRYFVTMNSF
jgi:myosin heavy subunit